MEEQYLPLPTVQPLGPPTSRTTGNVESLHCQGGLASEPPKSGESSRPMRKLARSMMNSWKARQIKEQGGVCPVSGRPFDPHNMQDAVIDHDHVTGEIRGVLLRSANAVEGKVKNAVARWGGTGEDYSKVIPYLKRLVAYLERPGTGLVYPMHKTKEDRMEAQRAKARERAAEVRAKRKLAQEQRQENE